MTKRPASTRGKKVRRARTRAVIPKYASAAVKSVWLTFDDGPHKTYTDKILGILDKHSIKATFFVVGRNCRLCPDVLKRISDAGHRIANHTYSHPDLTRLPEASVKAEIKRTEAIVSPYLKGDKLIRPPYGAHNRLVDRVVRQLGYRLVMWNVDTVDWSRHYKPNKWVRHGVDQIRSRTNSVVLNHDIHRTTADYLDSFIGKIKAMGRVRFESPADL